MADESKPVLILPQDVEATRLQLAREDFRRLGMRLRPVSIAFNAGFALLFSVLQVWPLVGCYLAGLLFQFWLGRASRRQSSPSNPLLLWAWVVLFLQSLLAVLAIGPGAGFQYYLVSTIPSGFASLNRPFYYKLIQAAFIVGFFIACDEWFNPAHALYPQSASVMSFLRHLNSMGAFALLAGVSHAHALAIKDAEDTLRRIASTDALTGLLNRRNITLTAERETARSQRCRQPVSLVLCDIDYFKRINDGWGHPAGDHVLQAIANLLQATVREYDSVARWGGEEFLMVLPNATQETARRIAERLRTKVANAHIVFEGQVIPVSMTLGVAQINPDENWHAAVARADDALYRGKEAGRDRVEMG